MRIPDFFKLGFLLVLGLGIIKLFFFRLFAMDNQYQIIAFWTVSALFTTGIIRRGGIINYLEAFAVGIVWTIATLLVDYLILATFIFGYGLFTRWYLWIGYFVVLATIFLIHKKRHVHIRRGGHIDSHH